ncbi:MAG: alpha/beta hydrolase [Solirubrobacterales bacterium]|nr:alpha/beta hydrolase [Solirubrobacterales bacterium]
MVLFPEARAALAELLETDDALVPGRSGFDLARARREGRLQCLRRMHSRPFPSPARAAELDAGGIRCRLFAPRGRAAVVLYLHGGGWALGSPEECEPFCRLLSVRSGWAVLAPEYRLAPEHPFPAALEDVERVVGWLRGHQHELTLDASRPALAGDSAGANLAAAIALRARDRGEPSYCLQALLCPAVDLIGDFRSREEFAHGFGLEPETMAWSTAAYVPHPADRARPEVSPLRAPSVAGLPPAMVATAEHDPLRDEGEAYAARLAEAGTPVVATRHLGAVHFFTDPTRFEAASTLIDQLASILRGVSDPGPA